jgi:hypothetical protein
MFQFEKRMQQLTQEKIARQQTALGCEDVLDDGEGRRIYPDIEGSFPLGTLLPMKGS